MKSLVLLALLTLSLLGDAHIFVYHRFGDSKHATTNTSETTLRKQFNYFKDNGYEVVTLAKLVKRLQAREAIPDNWVVLSIDDAYKSFYENGLPIFKEYGYPFTLFVYVEATQKRYRDFMSWRQLRDAAKYGEIALHSYAHPHLVAQSDAAIRSDTRKAFDLFTKSMGFAPKYYAYPYGEYNRRVTRALKDFGFDAVCNQNAGAIASFSDRYDLDRIALTGDGALAPKLRIKALRTEWIAPKSYPKDGILKTIHAKISPSIRTKRVRLYISGYGWRNVDVHRGEINVQTDIPLTMRRNRIFIKYRDAQSGIILVKEK